MKRFALLLLPLFIVSMAGCTTQPSSSEASSSAASSISSIQSSDASSPVHSSDSATSSSDSSTSSAPTQTVTKRMIRAYESVPFSVEIPAYFVGEIDAPFFNLADLDKTRVTKPGQHGFPLPPLTLSYEEGVLTATRTWKGKGYDLVFDANKDVIRSNAYAKAVSLYEYGGPRDPLGEDFSPIATPTTEDTPDLETSFIWDLGAYGIDLIAYENTVLVPLFVLNATYFYCGEKTYGYNGADIYTDAVVGADEANADIYFGFYHITDEQEGKPVYEDGFQILAPYNEATAAFNGASILATLERFYGLNGQRSFGSISDFAKTLGVYDDLFSTDPSAATYAVGYLCEAIDDMHTNFLLSSSATGSLMYELSAFQVFRKIKTEGRGDRARAYSNAKTENRTQRTNLAGEQAETGFYFVDDTCIIRFDSFARSDNDDVFDGHGGLKDVDYEDNTFTLFHAAFEALSKRNNIKNIVVDLSINGGGDVTTLVEIAGFFMEEVVCPDKDSITGEITDYSYKIDTNLDGTLDEKDYPGVNYNVFCMESETSFSCGNMLPAVFRYNAAATMIGRTGAGGPCTVMYASSAVGDFYRFSGHDLTVLPDGKGGYKDVDGGIEPELVLTNAQMYDNAALLEQLHQFIASCDA